MAEKNLWAQQQRQQTQDLIDRMGMDKDGPQSEDLWEAVRKLHERIAYLEGRADRGELS